VFEVDKPHDELKELADLVYVIYGYAYAKGWNLDEALKRVHENNVARMTQDDGTIKRREDGKIIKNPNTPKVKLHDLV
jgi:predicted HAD superfamily Cof-like phosphohydrolase